MKIKALSLWQPWATAMALKIKKNETRSWATSYRGLLAIHAAKRKPDEFESRMIESSVQWHNGSPTVVAPNPLPFGAIVCISMLVDCKPTHEVKNFISEQEEWWGNYASGRFAWITEPLDMISASIPLIGHQGLFDWELPAELAERVARMKT